MLVMMVGGNGIAALKGKGWQREHLAVVVMTLRCIAVCRKLSGGRQLFGHMSKLVGEKGDFERCRLLLLMRGRGEKVCSCYSRCRKEYNQQDGWNAVNAGSQEEGG